MNLIIGSHISYSSGLLSSTKEAISYGENAFMIYTGAPQNTIRKKIEIEDVKKAHKLMEENNINLDNVVVHAPYIINLANDKDERKYNFYINFLKEELKRTKELGINKVVLHPGSHVGLGEEKAIENIAYALNKVLDSDSPIILLETMAGKGTEIGKTFEELKQIIDKVDLKEKVMVCLDTCHISDAGYDLNDFDKILNEFDKVVGLNKLGLIHVNDSKNPCGSHKDRHENIGKGYIGFDNLINVIYHDKLKDIPKILETPYIDNKPPYKEEIEMILNAR